MYAYILQLADNPLILAQRLGEWCGHGPVLEQDIALTNMALDHLGQAQNLLTYAAELEGKGRDADQLACFRDAPEFRNVLLVEQPNEDWAYTIARQFFYDVFNYYNLDALRQSSDQRLADIAAKSFKEATYHLRFSSEWMIRLGDGTELSHTKIQKAVDDLWMFTNELTTPSPADTAALEQKIGPDLGAIRALWEQKVAAVLSEATLEKPTKTWMLYGGKTGVHTEYLSHMLTDMQFMQRTYPGLEW